MPRKQKTESNRKQDEWRHVGVMKRNKNTQQNLRTDAEYEEQETKLRFWEITKPEQRLRTPNTQKQHGSWQNQAQRACIRTAVIGWEKESKTCWAQLKPCWKWSAVAGNPGECFSEHVEDNYCPEMTWSSHTCSRFWSLFYYSDSHRGRL